MKNLLLLFVLLPFLSFGQKPDKALRNNHYITNQAPLVPQAYTALPLGNIKAKGWLLKMLELQRDGLTGQLDSIYELVCGPNNGWLGGTGDGWERGPYWIDGLLPLAHLLEDDQLKAKAQEWVDWAMDHQREDGYFGPLPLPDNYEKIPGTQQGNREDWWPKMVMLKVLQQHYMATEDKRVLELMTRYFQYQHKTLQDFPLGHWTYWGNRRGADNLAVVYWLYNITGDKFLLDLGEIIHEQTYDWTGVYSGEMIREVNPYPHLHCVNVAQGLKAPLIYYQSHPEEQYLNAAKLGLESLKKVHGFVNGMYGGDERLHGNDPSQGSELCSAVEMMYSFEHMLPITGDIYYADYLEKVAYNVLPTQHDDQFMRKQYFQQANQVLITDEERNFYNDNYGRIVYGVLTGYPCCTTNMHQGWPKFVQNLWYATADNGLAALVYGASEVTAKVGDGTEVTFKETTSYPFSDRINFTFEADKVVRFPLHLRVPAWCETPALSVNGQQIEATATNGIIIIDRRWEKGDKVELTLPMQVQTSLWNEGSVGVERGPLVYALKINEQWQEVKTEEWEHSFYEVLPKSNWNYGIRADNIKNKSFTVETYDLDTPMPWNLKNAPLALKTKACLVPQWELYNHSAGRIPARVRMKEEKCKEEEITLLPYGSTTLRVSQFPVITIVK